MSKFGNASEWLITVATLRSCFRRMEESESHPGTNRQPLVVSQTMLEFVQYTLRRGLPFGIVRRRSESVNLRGKARTRISSIWRLFITGIGNVNQSRAIWHCARSHCVGSFTWKGAQSHYVVGDVLIPASMGWHGSTRASRAKLLDRWG